MDIFHSDSTLQFAGFLSFPDISIPARALTFLTGKSGSGKSTYLRLLNATVLPSRGTILYRGKPIPEWPVLPYRREVLLAPQRDFLYDGTVRENFARFYGMREEAVPSDETIQEFLTLCCSDCSPDSLCTPLSGGEKQRVFLALFLSCQSPVLLLDEPTSALDEQTARRFFTRLKAYLAAHDMTVVCVCHSPELVREFQDHEVRLEDWHEQ